MATIRKSSHQYECNVCMIPIDRDRLLPWEKYARIETYPRERVNGVSEECYCSRDCLLTALLVNDYGSKNLLVTIPGKLEVIKLGRLGRKSNIGKILDMWKEKGPHVKDEWRLD